MGLQRPIDRSDSTSTDFPPFLMFLPVLCILVFITRMIQLWLLLTNNLLPIRNNLVAVTRVSSKLQITSFFISTTFWRFSIHLHISGKSKLKSDLPSDGYAVTSQDIFLLGTQNPISRISILRVVYFLYVTLRSALWPHLLFVYRCNVFPILRCCSAAGRRTCRRTVTDVSRVCSESQVVTDGWLRNDNVQKLGSALPRYVVNISYKYSM